MQFVGSETYDRKLNLPTGVLLTGEYPAGKLTMLSFQFYDSVTERRSLPEIIPYIPDERNGGSIYSPNAIETMIGEAHETWLKNVRAQGKKKPKMTVEQRKESTTGKIYFGGIKDDRKKLNRELKRKARITR